MNLRQLFLILVVLTVPYCLNAQTANSTSSVNTQYINTYGIIDIIGIVITILIVVFAYALQKRRSQILKIKNATQKQKIEMLDHEFATVMKEGARLQQEGGMLKEEYTTMMKEGAKLQHEREVLKKELNRMKKKTMKAGSR